jgi:ankyrin repeat protein
MDMRPIDHAVARALEGDESYVRTALESDPSLLRDRNMFGAGIAHAAVYSGQLDLLEILTRFGWKSDIVDAAELGDVSAVRAALDDDPDLVSRFVRTTTALHSAVYWGQRDLAQLLLAAGAGAVINEPTRDDFLQITPLGSAVATTPGIPQPSDNEDVVLALVRLLLENGADVNARRKDGMTALHAAAWRGHAIVVQELLDAGADATILATAGAHAGQAAADAALSQGHLVLAARLDTPNLATISPYG